MEVAVPLGGNAFVVDAPPDATEAIELSGLVNWTSADAVISTYFLVPSAGLLDISITAGLSGSETSAIRVLARDCAFDVELAAGPSKVYHAGAIDIDEPGYVRVDLCGVSKVGDFFGDVSALVLRGSAVEGGDGVLFANDTDNFYWSRRGPSVHLRFAAPEDTSEVYSEVTVPAGSDPVGSYFMANGFDQGYFGMQASSRRYLI
jgi:hypothetical protein